MFSNKRHYNTSFYLHLSLSPSTTRSPHLPYPSVGGFPACSTLQTLTKLSYPTVSPARRTAAASTLSGESHSGLASNCCTDVKVVEIEHTADQLFLSKSRQISPVYPPPTPSSVTAFPQAEGRVRVTLRWTFG